MFFDSHIQIFWTGYKIYICVIHTHQELMFFDNGGACPKLKGMSDSQCHCTAGQKETLNCSISHLGVIFLCRVRTIYTLWQYILQVISLYPSGSQSQRWITFFLQTSNIPSNYQGIIIFAPKLFFILILLQSYFDFLIKDFDQNHLAKIYIKSLQNDVVFLKKKNTIQREIYIENLKIE